SFNNWSVNETMVELQNLGSLWNKFMTQHYGHNTIHPTMIQHNAKLSPTWRRMINVKDLIEDHIVVLPQGGNTSFGYENRDGYGKLELNDHPLYDITISQAWNGDSWNMYNIKASNPNFRTDCLLNKTICPP
ncbi:hypothetical protein ACH5RR_037016, partial [Cinchona calisaya]